MKHKTTTGQKLLIAILIITLIAATILGLYAWAKYVTSIPGEATGQVAKWYFDVTNVSGTKLSKTDPINLADTIDFEHVKADRIAPGTSGKFEMVVDTTGTEVSLTYDIEIKLTNCPTNLIFYKAIGANPSFEGAEKISKDGDKLTFKGYVDKDKASTFTEIITVYWDWPYQTFDENGSSDKGDDEDMKYAGRTVSMEITATGTEVLEAPPPTLADYVKSGDIKVGHFIDYNPAKGTYQEITVEVDETGYDTTQKFTTTGSTTKWRVLKVNKDNVEIIPADGSGVNLQLGTSAAKWNTVALEKCKTAFLNSEEVINKVCKIYGYGYGAKSARSIDIEDIEAYYGTEAMSNKNPKEDYTASTSNTNKVGGTYEYTSGSNFLTELETDGEGIERKVTKYGDKFVSAPQTMTQTYYNFTGSTYFGATSPLYYTLFKQTNNSSNKNAYWLASRCVILYSSDSCIFRVRYVKSGNVNADGLFVSVGDTYSPSNEVCPVVTLDSNIPIKETTPKSGKWTLETENN